MNQECMKNNKNSAKLQDSDKVGLYIKKTKKEELSQTQRVKDSKKRFVFSESRLDNIF